MITSSNTMALNNHCATALGPRLGLGLRLDFGSQVWFVQYFSENFVVVLYALVKVRRVFSSSPPSRGGAGLGPRGEAVKGGVGREAAGG